MKTVILDNYDSFTYNLYQYIGELDARPAVFRNDQVSLEELKATRPDRIIISPGPGSPEDESYFGVCTQAILELGMYIPILGVCLGHQGIVHAFGGRIVRANEVMHGKTSCVAHKGIGIFSGLPASFEAMRYHSLAADPESLPECLEITAWSSDGVIMGVRHREYPIEGIQFHPESIGTAPGKRLLANFMSGILAPR
ncbi:MAG TPA: aminodeoxychorismate/anthranilate synthase component II [Bryobacteraceae bacterium]|nr:aminodeoxychorismate/anthranilate synthase component II [Bryobacteraceae bacterium]